MKSSVFFCFLNGLRLMMTTWADILSETRIELKDTGSNLKYADTLLYIYVKDALRDYSQHFPIKQRLELVAASGACTLPADFMNDITVENPEDSFLERRMARPGVRFKTTGQTPTRYHIQDGELHFNSSLPDGASVWLTYEARHPVPSAADDLTFVLTVPEDDEELIRLYMRAKALGQTRSSQSSLDRFKPGGRRDDNPLRPEVTNLMDEYYAKVAERFGGGVVLLYRPGRRLR